jgi:hypothetical protein
MKIAETIYNPRALQNSHFWHVLTVLQFSEFFFHRKIAENNHTCDMSILRTILPYSGITDVQSNLL